jgi:LmbE family N-acetylglucosaminyl deacetylase
MSTAIVTGFADRPAGKGRAALFPAFWPTLGWLLTLALWAAVVSSGRAAEPRREPPKKLRVVVFGAHCDDPESGAGGLIALLSRAGHQVIVGYATCFRGDRKVDGRPEGTVRRQEAEAACRIMGATPKFFPYAHEKLTADAATVAAVSAWLDEVKPDIVVTHWPLDTHPNHHVTSSLVWQCYRHSGGWNLYFFEVMTGRQSLGFQPQAYLDVGPVRDLKKQACFCHQSQHPEEFWQVHDEMHRARGRECGVAYAEAYSLVEAKPGAPLLPVAWLPKRP